jgi:hypothetical protein
MRALMLLLGVAACAAPQATLGSAVTEIPPAKPAPPRLEQQTSSWPSTSKKALRLMIDKYGQPDEIGNTHVVWHHKGSWKRVVVHAEGVLHDFPRPHEDVLEHVVSYRVPVDKFDDLAAFDGSLSAQRSVGELSSRCDREELNTLVLNVANEIASGKRTVEDGRRFTAQTAAAFMGGETTTYTQKLLFDPPRAARAGDRDRALITDSVRGMMNGPPED